MTSTEETLSNLLKEDRRFEPPEELAADANLKEEAYARADKDREAFWAEQAERLHWDTEVGPGARLVEPARSRSGSSAAPSTRRTTASTGTSRTASVTGSRSTGWVSPRTTPGR